MARAEKCEVKNRRQVEIQGHSQVVVAHAFYSSTRNSELKVRLVYRVSARTTGAVQKPCLEKTKRKEKRKEKAQKSLHTSEVKKSFRTGVVVHTHPGCALS